MTHFQWVTSFNAAIWNASTKEMWESFKEHNIPGEMIAGAEEYMPPNMPAFDVSTTSYRKAWKEENDELFPPNIPLCGKMCTDAWSKRDQDHTPGCPHSWWNRNAYRWHNKLATIVEVYNYHLYPAWPEDDLDVYLFWVDSDCRFNQPISEAFLKDILFPGSTELCFLRGNRPVMEAGFFGIKGMPSIKRFITLMQFIYKKENRKRYKRWDDSYLMQQVLYGIRKDKDEVEQQANAERKSRQKHRNSSHERRKLQKPNFKLHDLATTKGEHGEVFSRSKLSEFISHAKGRHGRKQSIFL